MLVQIWLVCSAVFGMEKELWEETMRCKWLQPRYALHSLGMSSNLDSTDLCRLENRKAKQAKGDKREQRVVWPSGSCFSSWMRWGSAQRKGQSEVADPCKAEMTRPGMLVRTKHEDWKSYYSVHSDSSDLEAGHEWNRLQAKCDEKVGYVRKVWTKCRLKEIKGT
jgi:hypothetical protein